MLHRDLEGTWLTFRGVNILPSIFATEHLRYGLLLHGFAVIVGLVEREFIRTRAALETIVACVVSLCIAVVDRDFGDDQHVGTYWAD
jgi:hypothetical protein